MTVDVLAPRDVQTTFNYSAQTTDGNVPYIYVQDPPEGVPKTNIQANPHAAVVHDARGRPADTFGLDVSGFEWTTYPSVEKAFMDEERIKTVYYAEVEEILKKHAGAKKVFIFDHTIRRSGKAALRTPVYRVHVDQTFEAAVQRVWLHLPEDAERLLKGRFKIINVWRPIENTVAHDPLAVADFRTVDVEADLVPMRLIYPHREGGVFNLRHNAGHKWYYLSDQTPDEVTLIKCFDSDTDKARLTPHSAFPDKTSPVDAPQRQSIEVRALVFDSE